MFSASTPMMMKPLSFASRSDCNCKVLPNSSSSVAKYQSTWAYPLIKNNKVIYIPSATAGSSEPSLTSNSTDISKLVEACRTKSVAPDDVVACMERIEQVQKRDKNLVKGKQMHLVFTF